MDGDAFGFVDSLAGGFADELPLSPLFELPPQAAADSESATTHSNNRLRFIRSPLKGSRQTERRRKPRTAAARAPATFEERCLFLGGGALFLLGRILGPRLAEGAPVDLASPRPLVTLAHVIAPLSLGNGAQSTTYPFESK